MKELIGNRTRQKPIQKAHGTLNIMSGRLRGRTDTDYFYFFCPDCGKILEVTKCYVTEKKYLHPENKIRVVFEIHCRKCKTWDYVKISDFGWKGGLYKLAEP